MVRKYTDAEYAALLPRKQVGTAVLFFDSEGKLLIVKPNYKDGWLVPGGAADENESPLNCAIREAREEIGLNISELNLVGIYFGHSHGVFSDSLKFIYYGGILIKEQIDDISLQSDELDRWEFVTIKEAMPLLSPSLRNCLTGCLDAIKDRKVAYFESPTGAGK